MRRCFILGLRRFKRVLRPLQKRLPYSVNYAVGCIRKPDSRPFIYAPTMGNHKIFADFAQAGMNSLRVRAEFTEAGARLLALLYARYPDRKIAIADFPANRLPTYVQGWSIGASISRDNEPAYFIDFHPDEILEPGFEWQLDKRLAAMPAPPEGLPATLLGKPVTITDTLAGGVRGIQLGAYRGRVELEITPDPNAPQGFKGFIGRIKRDAPE